MGRKRTRDVNNVCMACVELALGKAPVDIKFTHQRDESFGDKCPPKRDKRSGTKKAAGAAMAGAADASQREELKVRSFPCACNAQHAHAFCLTRVVLCVIPRSQAEAEAHLKEAEHKT